jgi:transposase
MDAALVHNRKRRGKAERRKKLAIGGAPQWLLALVADKPDLTLDEIVIAMRKRRIAGSRSAVWRFFNRRKITFKKKPARGGTRASGRGAGTSALDAGSRPV